MKVIEVTVRYKDVGDGYDIHKRWYCTYDAIRTDEEFPEFGIGEPLEVTIVPVDKDVKSGYPV